MSSVIASTRTPGGRGRPVPLEQANREEMRAIITAVARAPEFAAKFTTLNSGQQSVTFEHVTPEAFAFVVALLAAQLQEQAPGSRLWVLCGDSRSQDHLHADLAAWQVVAHYFPKLSANAPGVLPDPETSAERVSALARLRDKVTGQPVAIVLVADSLDEQAPPPGQLQASQLELRRGQRLDAEALMERFTDAGYERVPVVGERGQFARRGGILDFFSWHGEEPVRIELFDDQIESIRFFDVHTQSSVRKLEEIHVVLRLDDQISASGSVRDHLAKGDWVVAVECAPALPPSILITSGSDGSTVEDYSAAIHENPLGVFDASDFVLHEARRKQFDTQAAAWHADGWRVLIFFQNAAELERFTELVGAEKIRSLGVEPLLGLQHRGFIVPAAKIAVLTGAEIFGRHRQARRLRSSRLDEAQALRQARDLMSDLREGDYVVHAEYGIGRFEGVEIRDTETREETMVLQYAEGGRLFVPLAQTHMVSRYVGAGGKRPKLNKLGDGRWARTRRAVQSSVEAYAAQMLSIQAERATLKASPHPADSRWQGEFENSFPYRETPDQLRSVEEIKRDMESDKPMDRLLCADVGFGKTEVAVRAAFKAVMGGRQAAVLVPTTVLAQQHWSTFRERMSEFPVSVEMLCRLTPANKEREIIRGIHDGSVDIVIGTHRLISSDVRFKDLGLVVVDEEQRFGVKHKERFKELFRLIDVLSLSATPIPRTLYLALMGMRDMSTIETPPPNRHPVQTTICAYDERVIRAAVDAEIDRGGQVFLLHNRVLTIERVAARIRQLCPRARVLVGHGQMSGDMLEDVMQRFVEGEADVLVCTTIIESGVDIPNANTIIIDRADRFGLADLYQLRGRVGRSDRRAHAWLMLPRDAVTAGDARKRVNAIKQHTELGSGFKIAMRDLEIRGAGNLLGTAQSGHIAAIGFDLYCQMLKQAVGKSQGRKMARPVEVSLRADFLCMNESQMEDASPGTVPAFIPAYYMQDVRLRIQGYRMVAELSLRSELDELEARWRDQFGQLPPPVTNLLTCAAIRLAASHAGITEVEIEDRKLMLTRNGRLVQLNGKFPRLESPTPVKRLQEALRLLRNL